MSDRVCIASSGSVNAHISAEDLLSCCDSCGNGYVFILCVCLCVSVCVWGGRFWLLHNYCYLLVVDRDVPDVIFYYLAGTG